MNRSFASPDCQAAIGPGSYKARSEMRVRVILAKQPRQFRRNRDCESYPADERFVRHAGGLR